MAASNGVSLRIIPDTEGPFQFVLLNAVETFNVSDTAANVFSESKTVIGSTRLSNPRLKTDAEDARLKGRMALSRRGHDAARHHCLWFQ